MARPLFGLAMWVYRKATFAAKRTLTRSFGPTSPKGEGFNACRSAAVPTSTPPSGVPLEGGTHVFPGYRLLVTGYCFSLLVFPRTARRLIMPARYPAAKPLSMFTVATPATQELSMVSRAETPPKDAP